MRHIIVFLFAMFICSGSAQPYISKPEPGFYLLNTEALQIYDRYAKQYFQCSANFDSAAVQIEILKENLTARELKSTEAQSKISELMARSDAQDLEITGLKLNINNLELQLQERGKELKREKRKLVFFKIGAGAIAALAGYAILK